jgi:hypothetical protein
MSSFGARKEWRRLKKCVNNSRTRNIYIYTFFPNATTCPYRLRGPPPGCGRSVTDFWGWGAHRAQLRCPDDVRDDMYERGVTEGTLNLNSTGYPDHGRYGDLPLQGKIPMEEPGIKPGTLWLVVRGWSGQEIYVTWMRRRWREIRIRRKSKVRRRRGAGGRGRGRRSNCSDDGGSGNCRRVATVEKEVEILAQDEVLSKTKRNIKENERPVCRYKHESSVIKGRVQRRTRIKYNWSGKGIKEGEEIV